MRGFRAQYGHRLKLRSALVAGVIGAGVFGAAAPAEARCGVPQRLEAYSNGYCSPRGDGQPAGPVQTVLARSTTSTGAAAQSRVCVSASDYAGNVAFGYTCGQNLGSADNWISQNYGGYYGFGVGRNDIGSAHYIMIGTLG